MTDAERREAARQFYQKWTGKGREDEDARSYWIDFLQNIMGIDHVTDRVDFEKKVIGPDGNTKRIDAYIPETRVLIEQKSLGIALDKPQQGHNGMTPYEQAKMYDNSLPFDEKSRWIIVSNFAEIWIYDLNEKRPEPNKLLLSDIQSKYSLFEFLVNKNQQKISQEMEVSIEAGKFVGLIYDALLKQYINPESEESLKSLNMLCVRLVFCLYAEDAHIFGDNGHMFHDYLDSFETKDIRKALIELFRILDTPEEKRDPYDDSLLSQFPYVNGGLFADEEIEIPRFTEEIRDILLAKASEGFDWSMISPTIFGAVFESTLNPETRRSGGMHYTSIENIHKVIDPLFLDDLKDELKEIKEIQVVNTKKARLKAYQEKLSSLKWLDPACGSGNFLTETYISIRRLENDVIKTLKGGQMELITDEEFSPIKVSIDQFYGIEINDFAVTVAKTALWIAESQMMRETEDILLQQLKFLPLTTNAHIVEGNALRIDWNEVCHRNKMNFVMGNPPFVGMAMMSKEQKSELGELFKGNKKSGTLDYVSGWYLKALRYINNTRIKVAFVSTNSVTQGEQIGAMWKYLFDEEPEMRIIFGYRTFVWNSEAKIKAAVHCVIVGFCAYQYDGDRVIYQSDEYKKCSSITPYLTEGEPVFVERRTKPLSDVPPIHRGNQPTDGGNLIIEEEDYEEFIKREPKAGKFIKRFMMGYEFINNKKRYCLWLVDASPKELSEMPLVIERVKKVKEMREASTFEQTRRMADTPTRFREQINPDTFIAIPKVSSERRRYIPMGYLDNNTIPGDKLFIIENAQLYHFGVLESNVHMAWMRAVAGRLKSDYSYSKDIVYNCFVWPELSEEQKEKIGHTAQMILDARDKYPDSSLAELYNPLTMPPELQKAHTENDRAVMQAYGFDIKNTSEADCVAALMKMYQELTSKETK